MSSAADRGASFLDRRIIPADFDWREYDVVEEQHKVKPASAYGQEVEALFRGEQVLTGALWPWDKANDRGLRVRPGEVSIYAGINGHRKSLLTSQVALSLMRQDEPVLIASFEMRPAKTLQRMVKQAAATGSPADAYLAAWRRWSEGRLWLYDHLGNCSPRQMIAVARYAITQLGVRQVFIDSMMKVVDATDDYTAQKRFVGALNALTLAHPAHVHLVVHARKGRDESAPIDKWDVKGAGEITDQADNVLLVNKHEPKGEDEPSQWLTVAKQRDGAFEGKLGLYFDPEALSFAEHAGKRWPGVSPRALELAYDAERVAIMGEGSGG